MKKIFLYLFVACLFATLTNASAFSEALSPDALSLDQALRIAFAHNPKVAEAKKEISASKGKWFDAEMLDDPQLETDIGGLKAKTQDQKIVRKGNLDAFTITQPLDPIGTHFLKAGIAHDNVKIAKGELRTVWFEIRKNVISTYMNILSQEKAVEIADENLTITKEFLNKVEIKFNGGSVPRSDVLRAKIEVSRAENNLLVNQKDLKVAQGTLNLLLGQDAENMLKLNGALNYTKLKYRYDETIKKTALANRSDLKNEEIRFKSAKKSLWIAGLEGVFPKMSIGVQRSTQDFQNDTSIILQGSYPLWGFNFGKIKEANAEKEKQEIHLKAAKREVGLDIYQAFLEAELSDRQVILQQKAVEEANELLKQVTLKYEEGEVSFLNYLENIKTIKETKTEYYSALKNYQEKVAELESAIQSSETPYGDIK